MTAAVVGTELADLVAEAVTRHLGDGPTRKVVIAMSRDDNPKVTVLAFREGARHPALAVKAATTPVGQAAVEREAEALSRVARLDPDGLVGATVPTLIEVQRRGGHTLLVATARAGVPLSTGYHHWRHTASPRRVGRDFADAAGWLGRLGGVARLPCQPPDWAGRLRERWAAEPAVEVCAPVAERLEWQLGTADGGVVHGDFWCGNVLRHHGVVSGVVDWEHALFGADPVRDRSRFALAYTLYLDRHSRTGARVSGHPGLCAGSWGQPVRYLLRGHGWYPELVARFVGDGLAATGRPPALWREALLLGLVEVAVLGDQPQFARQHLDLAAELVADGTAAP